MQKFDDLAAFAAVVRERSFTRAAAQLGVSQSALSQTVRALERRVDLKLLHRTTRSVSPTEAGDRLYRAVATRFADIEAELSALGELRGRPAGTVRITASEHAARTLVWPRLEPWLRLFPDIQIELASDNRFTDIVAERYDIGVRLGADVARDMIAVRMAPDLRMAVVGTPAYFRRHAPPRTPQDLLEHDCIRLRLPTHGGMLNWEFKRRGRIVNALVSGRLVFNTTELIVQAVRAGHGLAWVPEDTVEGSIASGQLIPVLEAWRATYPGYHFYYASRRASPAVEIVAGALRPPS